jgi:hypothetical protein
MHAINKYMALKYNMLEILFLWKPVINYLPKRWNFLLYLLSIFNVNLFQSIKG